jgi:drug/metabolite transporter (DMT)-like permease
VVKSGGTDRSSGIAFAVAAASSYALVPNLVRAAYNAGIPALEAVCTRTAVVAVVLFCVALTKKISFNFPKAAWPGFALMFLATLAVSACYLSSVQFISVGMAVTLFYTFPIIVAVASPLIEGRNPSGLLLSLAALAFVGLVLAIGPAFSDLDWRGVALAIASAFGCALQFFSGRMLSHHMQPAAFGSLIHVLLLPVVIAIMLYAGGSHVQLTQFSITSLAVISVLCMAIAYCAGYFFHMSAVNKAPSDVVAPYFNLEPVLTIVIATLFLGEKLGVVQLAGIALVIVALIAVNRMDRKQVLA